MSTYGPIFYHSFYNPAESSNMNYANYELFVKKLNLIRNTPISQKTCEELKEEEDCFNTECIIKFLCLVDIAPNDQVFNLTDIETVFNVNVIPPYAYYHRCVDIDYIFNMKTESTKHIVGHINKINILRRIVFRSICADSVSYIISSKLAYMPQYNLLNQHFDLKFELLFFTKYAFHIWKRKDNTKSLKVISIGRMPLEIKSDEIDKEDLDMYKIKVKDWKKNISTPQNTGLYNHKIGCDLVLDMLLLDKDTDE